MNKAIWKGGEAMLWVLDCLIKKVLELREEELKASPVQTDEAHELLNVMDGLSYSISHLKDALRIHNATLSYKEYKHGENN
jgi:hypothetical protein